MSRLLTNKRRAANLLLATALIALPGCTGAPWERSFWHPPAASGAEPITTGPVYPIQRATGEGNSAAWPNLADVPAKSDNPLPPDLAEQQLNALSNDRTTATARAATLTKPSAAMATSSTSAIAVPSQSPSPPPEL